MGKGIAIGIVIVLAAGFLITAIVPEMSVATQERSWLSLGNDYPYNTGSTEIQTGGYVRVCPGEVITVNVKVGSVTIYIDTGTAAINWSDGITEGSGYKVGSGNFFIYQAASSAVSSHWVRVSSYDVVYVQVNAANSFTYNVTVSRDAGTFVQDTKSISDRLDALNSLFNSTVAVLNSTITNLTARLDTASGTYQR